MCLQYVSSGETSTMWVKSGLSFKTQRCTLNQTTPLTISMLPDACNHGNRQRAPKILAYSSVCLTARVNRWLIIHKKLQVKNLRSYLTSLITHIKAWIRPSKQSLHVLYWTLKPAPHTHVKTEHCILIFKDTECLCLCSSIAVNTMVLLKWYSLDVWTLKNSHHDTDSLREML